MLSHRIDRFVEDVNHNTHYSAKLLFFRWLFSTYHFQYLTICHLQLCAHLFLGSLFIYVFLSCLYSNNLLNSAVLHHKMTTSSDKYLENSAKK